jgi:hypothetical protein
MRLATHAFSVTRGGTTNVLTNLAAYVQPAGPNVLAFQDIPTSKAYQMVFDGKPALKEQDVLVSEADDTETYLVVGVSKNFTPRLGHTSVVAQALWGS